MTKDLKKEHKIKCFKCKKYFDNVIIFKDNEANDYQKGKWFCADCFNKECFDKGKQAQKQEFEKMISKLKHSGWISKDILYDNCKGDEDICVIDIAELRAKLKEQEKK